MKYKKECIGLKLCKGLCIIEAIINNKTVMEICSFLFIVINFIKIFENKKIIKIKGMYQ
ncbi:hypothetical protein GCM10011397_13270 [Wenyingzhuangia marina]|nr:hypothetical protein GCM10011397_13270 [Wenyingzhuangia marina]